MDTSDEDQPFNVRDGFEEESDEDSLRPSKRRKTKGSTLRTRGLAFVQKSAGDDDNEAQDDGDQEDDDDDDVDDARPTMGGMGDGMGGFRGFNMGQQPSRSPTPELQEEEEPSKPIGGGESAFGRGGKVNQNSFAARMMAKMGHKEGQGLGKAGQGIAAPIQAKKVQAGTGLGFGEQGGPPQRPAKTVKDKAHQGKIRSGTSTPRLKGPPKKKYEVSAIESRGLHVPDALKNIIDATGAETKRLESYSGYSTPTSETSRVATEEDKKQARLKRDLQLFADAWDGQIQEAEVLNQELQQREAESTHCTEQSRLFQDLVASFERVAVDDSQMTRTFDQIVVRLQNIQTQHADYIEPLDLSEVAVSALSQPLQAVFLEWGEPLKDPGTNLAKQLLSLASLLQIPKTAQSRHRKRTTPFESLLLKLLYPHLREALRSWTVYDPLPAIDLIDTWFPKILPPWMLYRLLHEIVVPRLIEAVKKFKPSKAGHRRKHDLPDLHEWLFDWWTLLDSPDLALESMTQLKVEIKSKVRFDDRVWPKWEPLLGSRHKPTKPATAPPVSVKTQFTSAVEDEITFKDILEEWCIENDLMLRNTGSADGLGRRLLRLLPAGKSGGGMLIYVQDDVVFESASGDPYVLDEELAERARTGK